MAGIEPRSQADIVLAIVNYVRAYNQLVELMPGDPITDALVTAQGPVISDIETLLDYTRKTNSLDGIEEFLNNEDMLNEMQFIMKKSRSELLEILRVDLERRLHDYGVTAQPEEYARGSVWYYRLSAPTEDVYVAVGEVVQTEPDPGEEVQQYVVAHEAVMRASNPDSYLTYAPMLAAATGRDWIWKVEVSVVASEPGSAGNQPAGKIRNLPGGGSGWSGVYNPTPTRDGFDEESNESMIGRGRMAWQGREIGAQGGLKRFALDNGALDAMVISWGDPIMTRDGGGIGRRGWGGMSDVWVRGERPNSMTGEQKTGAQVVYKFAERADDAGVVRYFTIAEVYPTYQPIVSIDAAGVTVMNADTSTSVPVNSVFLVKDTGGNFGSMKAKDKIQVYVEGKFQNLTVTYSYVYDQFPATLQGAVGMVENRYVVGDVLIRAGIKSPLAMQFTVAVLPGFDKIRTFNNVVTNISNFVNNLGLGGRNSPSYRPGQPGRLAEDDLVTLIKAVPGVDRMVPDPEGRLFTVLDRRPGTEVGDIVVADNEYIIADADTFLNVTYF